MARPTLTVIIDHEIVSRMTLAGPVTLGRLTDNSLVLSDSSVSGHHGRIERGPRGWRYTDMGSSNGSLIAAGPRLSQDEHYSMGDVTQILVGATVLEFDPKDDVPSNAEPSTTSVIFATPPSSEVRVPTGRAPHSDERLTDATTGFIVTNGEQMPPGEVMHLAGGADELPGLPSHPHQSRPKSSGHGARPVSPQGNPAQGDPPRSMSANSSPPSRPSEAPPHAGRPAATGLTPASRESGPTPGDPASQSTYAIEPPTEQLKPKTRPLVETAGTPRILVVLGDVVTTVELEQTVNTLGRSQRCDVIIDDASVSSRHAEISYADGNWTVRDLDSTNGTRLGLVRIDGPHELMSNCHLILGAADLLFVHDAMSDKKRLDPERFLRWLRTRRKVTRSQARHALVEAQRSGRSVGEILVSWGILKPGTLTELSHNAALGSSIHSLIPPDIQGWIWVALTLTVIAAAAAFVIFS